MVLWYEAEFCDELQWKLQKMWSWSAQGGSQVTWRILTKFKNCISLRYISTNNLLWKVYRRGESRASGHVTVWWIECKFSDKSEEVNVSYLQSGEDNFGYRGEVGVPQELTLLAQNQDPVAAYRASHGRNLQDGPKDKTVTDQIRTPGPQYYEADMPTTSTTRRLWLSTIQATIFFPSNDCRWCVFVCVRGQQLPLHILNSQVMM